jgi:hypothetical protein
MKHRIKEVEYKSGEVTFAVQTRFMFIWWDETIDEPLGTFLVTHDTYAEACNSMVKNIPVKTTYHRPERGNT